MRFSCNVFFIFKSIGCVVIVYTAIFHFPPASYYKFVGSVFFPSTLKLDPRHQIISIKASALRKETLNPDRAG